jgi:hypothetical protein
MKLSYICAWCRCSLGELPYEYLDERLPAVSHGICTVCSAKLFGGRELHPNATAESHNEMAENL